MAVTIAQGPVDTVEPFPETYAFLLELMEKAAVIPPACPPCAIGFTPDETIISIEKPGAER